LGILKARGIGKFDVVVDFCAYTKKDIGVTLPVLSGKCDLYLYISTGIS
jgi:hypothetical protein